MKTRLLTAMFFLILGATTCHASWLIYHKPEFKGKVVDLDTGEPIEGAVVIAIYQKKTLNPPVEDYVSSIHAKETLTDQNGEFRISSYTTMINPFSSSYDVEFIVFKPGYVWERPVHLERTLSGQGTSDFDMPTWWDRNLKCIVLKSGTIKIPKVRSDSDRINSFGGASEVYNFKKILPVSFEIIEKERLHVIELRMKGRMSK